MTIRLVTSYVNPDTDGIACMLAYEAAVRVVEPAFSGQIRPIMFGRINPETAAVLEYLAVVAPPAGDSAILTSADEICLMDTHHRSQLPELFPFEKVIEVIDHHGAGDAPLVNAQVQNEAVGAAVTLMAERFRAVGSVPPLQVVMLMGAGILSNTLDFKAPSTTDRDRQAFDWVRENSTWPADLAVELSEARKRLLDGSTIEILNADVKLFQVEGDRCLAMSQLEAANSSLIGGRGDLVEALAALAELRGADAVIVNLADLSIGRSLLLSPDEWVCQKLTRRFGVTFDAEHRGWADGLFLRKTHLVPTLVGLGSQWESSRIHGWFGRDSRCRA